MASVKELAKKAAELLKKEAVIITAVEMKHNIVERIQVYFWSDGQAVMDVISKDDLVQNWPDTGVYTLNADGGKFHQVAMFEGAEDMYFRIDGTKIEADDFGKLPSVLFLETVEAICALK